jgi:glycerol kinase
MLENIPDARKKAEDGRLLFGTIDSWLLWNLSGGRVHATDYTNASRTMLYDIHQLGWDEEILAYLNIPQPCCRRYAPAVKFTDYARQICWEKKSPWLAWPAINKPPSSVSTALRPVPPKTPMAPAVFY